MESSSSINNLRTQLCIIFTGIGEGVNKTQAWPRALQDFLKYLHKLSVHITIIGPKITNKLKNKKTLRFLEHHEVIGMKYLEASTVQRLEFRILNQKNKSWMRLRTDACVTIGRSGVWPPFYESWHTPGIIHIDALWRWLLEFKLLPGSKFIFLGSSNQVFRCASLLLDRSVEACYVVEKEEKPHSWRSHQDRFTAKGGRILTQHSLLHIENDEFGINKVHLNHSQGTLILPIDTLVVSTINENALNTPDQWKQGMFYIQRRTSPLENIVDEEQWLEQLDWKEVYWRLTKFLNLTNHSEADGALKTLRQNRKEMQSYRKLNSKRELHYNGKILNLETLKNLKSSGSVPKTFAQKKPIASLECFENIACRACADACPENAIEIKKITDLPHLLEEKCTGCGACIAVCPTGAAIAIQEHPPQQKARYFLPDDTKELWKTGEFVELLNRKGDTLGTARVMNSFSYEKKPHRVLEVEATHVYLWDARAFKKNKPSFSIDSNTTINEAKHGWILLNETRRLVRLKVPLTIALWSLGYKRFSDAFFCHDGSCRLCTINVNGKTHLACQTKTQEGQRIAFEINKYPSQHKDILCPCNDVSLTEFLHLLKEGVSESLACENTGLGHGTCHGKWCLGAQILRQKENPRLTFPGYTHSPWRELWADEVLIPLKKIDR